MRNIHYPARTIIREILQDVSQRISPHSESRVGTWHEGTILVGFCAMHPEWKFYMPYINKDCLRYIKSYKYYAREFHDMSYRRVEEYTVEEIEQVILDAYSDTFTPYEWVPL